MARSGQIAKLRAECGWRTPPPGPRKVPPGRAPSQDPSFTRRLSITPNRVRIYAWPSRGGVIVLNATLVDFEFLGWDPRLPPDREKDQEKEDAICQRLLHLGATWYDSEERLRFLDGFEDDPKRSRSKMESGECHPPTRRERRWVKVGWPSDGKGLWVYEVDNDDVFGHEHCAGGSDVGIPQDAGLLLLARNMDERCSIIEELGGEFFASLEEYKGQACINAWNGKMEHS